MQVEVQVFADQFERGEILAAVDGDLVRGQAGNLPHGRDDPFVFVVRGQPVHLLENRIPDRAWHMAASARFRTAVHPLHCLRDFAKPRKAGLTAQDQAQNRAAAVAGTT